MKDIWLFRVGSLKKDVSSALRWSVAGPRRALCACRAACAAPPRNCPRYTRTACAHATRGVEGEDSRVASARSEAHGGSASARRRGGDASACHLPLEGVGPALARVGAQRRGGVGVAGGLQRARAAGGPEAALVAGHVRGAALAHDGHGGAATWHADRGGTQSGVRGDTRQRGDSRAFAPRWPPPPEQTPPGA